MSDESSTSNRVRVIREGVASYLPDIDPDETSEWIGSLDGLIDAAGPARARYLMLRLLERAGERHVSIPSLTSTDSTSSPVQRTVSSPSASACSPSQRQKLPRLMM